MIKKPKAEQLTPQTAMPSEDEDRQESPLSFGNTVRDSKGRYPDSLNVGGTHSRKKHPGARHVKD